MKHVKNKPALKPLLLCSAAIVTLAWQPSFAQERSQVPAQQDRPAAAQSQSPSYEQPDARQDRAPDRSQTQQKGTSGQAPADTSADAPSDTKSRATKDKDRARDAKSPPAQGKEQRQQTQSRDGAKDKQQAQPRDNDRTQQRGQARDTGQTKDRDAARSQQERDRGMQDAARTGTDARQARQPTEQQRTRIATSIERANVQPLRNVNFSVSVGTVIPRSVRVYPITPAIVEVYPQYRGYSFVVVDEEIVIIEPRSKRIVTVIDKGGGGRAAVRSKLKLSDQDRDVIRRTATERRTTGSAPSVSIERELVIGDDLPEAVEIESFPETIYTEVPEIRSYRYIVRDRDVYLVDPTERRVIDIIR